MVPQYRFVEFLQQDQFRLIDIGAAGYAQLVGQHQAP